MSFDKRKKATVARAVIFRIWIIRRIPQMRYIVRLSHWRRAWGEQQPRARALLMESPALTEELLLLLRCERVDTGVLAGEPDEVQTKSENVKHARLYELTQRASSLPFQRMPKIVRGLLSMTP